MTVKVYERSKGLSGWLTRFLTRNHVQHQLVSPEEVGVNRAHLRHLASVAVEVDGRLFVNPNEDALKKILHVE
jgi:hypothetical protein